MGRCGYPQWTITAAKKEIVAAQQTTTDKQSKKLIQHQEASRGMVVLPYVKGLSEATSRIMKKYITTAMNPLNTIRRVLVRPKEKVDAHKKCEGMYAVKTAIPSISVRLSEH